jgi:hypothetical protein
MCRAAVPACRATSPVPWVVALFSPLAGLTILAREAIATPAVTLVCAMALAHARSTLPTPRAARLLVRGWSRRRPRLVTARGLVAILSSWIVLPTFVPRARANRIAQALAVQTGTSVCRQPRTARPLVLAANGRMGSLVQIPANASRASAWTACVARAAAPAPVGVAPCPDRPVNA